MFITVGNGKCSSDCMWTSLRGQKIQSDGHCMPKSSNPSLHCSSNFKHLVLVLWCISSCYQAIGRHRRHRSNLCPWPHTATPRFCSLLPYAKVLASTKHCEPNCLHFSGSVPFPCSSFMACGVCFQAWNTCCSSLT